MQTPAAPPCAGHSCTCSATTPLRGSPFGTAHAYVTAVTALLAEQAPDLLKTLRAHDPDFVLLDGTLAECDRVGDGRADYSSNTSATG
ncbi:hypothetical protein GCM10022295_89370 [Streptomyces osmaniensis]|uniref:Hcy-binding domain-containing protein n=1 Tax=Streptomyces osmaniensis TaxID=593134 RepID=A0ABP6Z164_9ACTN